VITTDLNAARLVCPVTEYVYDDAGRLLEVIDPLSRVTEYVYF
jgi:hypothetical protein